MRRRSLDEHVLERVRECLAGLKGSQTAIGERFGLTQKQVSRLKTDQWVLPPPSVLDAIAVAGGTSLMEILADHPDYTGQPPALSPKLKSLVETYRRLRSAEHRLALVAMAEGYEQLERESPQQSRKPRPARPS